LNKMGDYSCPYLGYDLNQEGKYPCVIPGKVSFSCMEENFLSCEFYKESLLEKEVGEVD